MHFLYIIFFILNLFFNFKVISTEVIIQQNRRNRRLYYERLAIAGEDLNKGDEVPYQAILNLIPYVSI